MMFMTTVLTQIHSRRQKRTVPWLSASRGTLSPPIKQRSRLGHAVADKLVYAHEALHLREKLQSASYMQKVEYTDSDSDYSDDEKDLSQ